jgi:hypothetical protein
MRKHRYIIRAALVAVLIVVNFADTGRANDPIWPQFRGDAANDIV